MTPEQLKASILQYAIQGKLTPQIESDGTAKSLLESCSTGAEIDGRRVKQKIIAEIADDEKTFDIPESWEWVKLGNVCTIARGGSPRPIKEYITTADDGINWIKIGDTEKDGKYICSTAEKIKPSGASKSRMVHAGDFLLTNSMSFGRPYILKVDGCIHDGWLVISQTKEVFYQDYLYWMLSSRYAYFQFCDKVSGAVVKNLNSDKVANSVFPLPPLSEQKRIVAKIEELLPYVDRYAAAYEKLEQFNAKFPEDMKKSILQYAIQGKLVDQRPEEGTGEELYRQIQTEKQRLIKEGKIKKEKPLAEIVEEEIPFDIPTNWKWCRLRDICTKIVDGDHNPPSGVKYPTDFLMLSATNINNGTLMDLNKVRYVTEEVFAVENQRTRVEMNDIFFTIVGSMGRSCVYRGGYNLCFQRSVAVLTTLVMPEFLKYVLDTPYIQFFMYANATGTAQKGFYLNQVENLVIPVPPLAEQRRIVAKLEEILPLCERLK